MRVSTNLMFQRSVSSMLEQQVELTKTQLQLASGKRLLRPSDDPSAAARVMDLGQSLEVVDQYERNANFARARLGLEENVLVTAGNLMQRARELAIQANNSTLTAEDRSAIATELREHLDEMFSLANTRDSNGEYIFAGFQRNAQPYSRDASGGFFYSGDQGQRYLQIGGSRRVADGDSGAEVFQSIRNGNGTFFTANDAGNNGGGVISPGAVVDASLYDGDRYTLLFPITTSASGVLNFNDFLGTNDALTYTLEINGNVVYQVDDNNSGTAPSDLAGIAGQINDDSATTNVKAYVSGGQLYLAYQSPSGNPITVTERLTNSSDGDSDTIVGYFGSVLTGTTTPTNTLSYNVGAAQDYLVVDSAGNVETSGTFQEDVAIGFNGIQVALKGVPQIHDAFLISPSVNKDIFSMLEELASALEGSSGSAGVGNAVNRALTDIDQALNHIIDIRAGVGGRLNTIDDQSLINGEVSERLQTTLSGIQDLDYGEAVSRFNLQLIALQAAQQSFQKVQGLSLFNFL